MRGNWLAIAFVASVASFATAQTAGRITGTVLNEDGQVVNDATVCTSVASGNSTSINCNIFTDNGGQFQIDKLRLGNYGLFAINEAEGYSIQNQNPGQKVALTTENPSQNVTVRLRPGGAVLIGTVRNKISGEPVKGVSVQYLDVDGKASGSSPFSASDGEFHVALPPQCDLVIVVSAKGYKGWVYTDPSNPSRPVLRLAAGDRKTVDVELEPSGER
jgi:uncharacterized surface anchored protein